MKALICGAGVVGASIASYLVAEGDDVTVVDNDPDRLRYITQSLDLRGIGGHAANPRILEEAGAGETDLMVATSREDEVNMITCQVAHSLFRLPMKIARVRQRIYLDPAWSHLFTPDHFPIDYIISPEAEVAHAIAQRIEIPGAIEMLTLAEGRLLLIGLFCGDSCPLLDTPFSQLKELFPDLSFGIIGVKRQEKAFLTKAHEHLLSGDEAYFVVDRDHRDRALRAFGYRDIEAVSKTIVILGGGIVGFSLAESLEKRTENDRLSVKIIEINRERAREIARSLSDTTVLYGDALDPILLEEAGVDKAKEVIAVTHDDKVNILASLMARRLGAQRIVALVNRPELASLSQDAEHINTILAPQTITISSILRHVRQGRVQSVHSLSFCEIIEADAIESSRIVGAGIKDTVLLDGMLIAALLRDNEVIIPHDKTKVRIGDRVILAANTKCAKAADKILRAHPEFF